ncbi:hypothetical protein GCM10010274_24220 [Streptomyces lavendofoliae]|uniref:Uncharacterized protein n=1 Tax=Streptomyces lavendofoliae TaxID=67314 RepID=A0A918M3S4_9ACTN|nr:hypothetical protein GCM10010274_24220 [Streptomyces lavendofoliae]
MGLRWKWPSWRSRAWSSRTRSFSVPSAISTLSPGGAGVAGGAESAGSAPPAAEAPEDGEAVAAGDGAVEPDADPPAAPTAWAVQPVAARATAAAARTVLRMTDVRCM